MAYEYSTNKTDKVLDKLTTALKKDIFKEFKASYDFFNAASEEAEVGLKSIDAFIRVSNGVNLDIYLWPKKHNYIDEDLSSEISFPLLIKKELDRNNKNELKQLLNSLEFITDKVRTHLNA